MARAKSAPPAIDNTPIRTPNLVVRLSNAPRWRANLSRPMIAPPSNTHSANRSASVQIVNERSAQLFC